MLGSGFPVGSGQIQAALAPFSLWSRSYSNSPPPALDIISSSGRFNQYLPYRLIADSGEISDQSRPSIPALPNQACHQQLVLVPSSILQSPALLIAQPASKAHHPCIYCTSGRRGALHYDSGHDQARRPCFSILYRRCVEESTLQKRSLS
ncbi:hypothetical protein BJY01DRAFT_209438 [Aspergillus pseudoustus]|uniref:Uncharacterized protein n=1 Tax=Aspergillus pseudoustus TaxID=1810923 RepID=A0ABR4KG91_9EURO